MKRDGDTWRQVSWQTVARAVAMGWTWQGRILRSRRGTVFEISYRRQPFMARRYQERRFPDA
jgi:hypothetical protein